jgi:S1-C subfamily serine protease
MFKVRMIKTLATLVAVAATLSMTAAFAQEPSGEQLESQQRVLAEKAAQLENQQRELQRARAELERARTEMEAAARQITRLSSGRTGTIYAQRAGGPYAFGQMRIGANIQNADTGALVLGVTPGGPADSAGMLSGDIITSVNGVEVVHVGGEPAEIVVGTLRNAEPDTVVPILVSRAGELIALDVGPSEVASFTIATRPMPGLFGDFGFDFEMPNLPNLPNFPGGPAIARNVTRFIDLPGVFASRWRNMELVPLTEELGSYFGTDDGLLVIRAPNNDDLDLRDGDVILAIGGREPASPEHAMRILTSFVPGETLEFSIMRRERRQSIQYAIPGRGSEAEAKD